MLWASKSLIWFFTLAQLALTAFANSVYAAHGPSFAHHRYFRRQAPAGFALAASGSLSGYGLSSTCEQVLYQTVKCDDYVASLGARAYHSGLGDDVLTASVCLASCGTSLETMHRRVAGACASTPELFPGYPVVALIDSIWGGWNETCIKDPTSGQNCNDVIESYPDVENIKDLPKDQLCSACNVNKYAAMQRNPYGVYDATYMRPRYETIVRTCGLTGVVTIPTPPTISLTVTEPEAPSCQIKSYIVKAGDTCDSIAQANSISSGTLYDTNPKLTNCSTPIVGTKLCLPSQCEKLYKVKSGEGCVSAANANGISWQQLVDWNGMVDCSGVDMLKDLPDWGSTICVSPPGGTFTAPPANETIGGVGGPGASGDGYAQEVISPPPGASLADGTTLNCGQFYTAKTGDTCALITVNSNVASDLFIATNPSLRAARTCDARLIIGKTYCLHPVRNWDNPTPTATMQ